MLHTWPSLPVSLSKSKERGRGRNPTRNTEVHLVEFSSHFPRKRCFWPHNGGKGTPHSQKIRLYPPRSCSSNPGSCLSWLQGAWFPLPVTWPSFSSREVEWVEEEINPAWNSIKNHVDFCLEKQRSRAGYTAADPLDLLLPTSKHICS